MENEKTITRLKKYQEAATKLFSHNANTADVLEKSGDLTGISGDSDKNRL